MLGFIKKDLAIIKSNFKILGILIICYIFMSISGKMDISFILPFMSVMIMISSFSYDTYNKWDAYLITLPNGRKNSVKAKYGATILLIGITSIVTILISCLISFKSINFEELLVTNLGTIFGTLLVLSIMYPIIYKFGLEKARIMIFAGVFGVVIIGGFLLEKIDLTNVLNTLAFLENYLILILIIVMIIMVYISYFISLKIQMNKEY